ncbi:hypothetical protein FTO70_14330 [Methanosarcina sp. KYL-1]|uniref:hypothetical protein n=1 Tax=Methanosarcina sp. KYL-1 TaxID=2602068 RepID=UPI0021012E55|nr:hypothetical protein [Methanosarcina sp. KYL-1]MCQ1536827.1 hypothetical protein [Methanosarcina sp. KYL-1]
MTATLSQLKRELIELRKLVDRQNPGIDPIIIYDPLRGSPDLSGLPDAVYICLPAKDGETLGIWEGPYLLAQAVV